MKQEYYGWLVVNHFIDSQKFEEIFSMLLDAAGHYHLHLEKKTNAELCALFPIGCGANEPEKTGDIPDFVLFWDKDIRLAKHLESLGLRLYNSADAIEVCDDKALTFIRLNKSKIRMPKTYLAPMTFRPSGYPSDPLVLQAANEIGYPLILKECRGSFGQQVHLIEDEEMLLQCYSSLGNRAFLIQEYIGESYGRDIRLHIVGGKAVAAMQRYNDSDFRANITNGGKMMPYEPTAQEIEMAAEACRILGVDFAGVDIMFGANGPVLCEVNSNAHFKNIYECTGINVGDAIMEYIFEDQSKKDGGCSR
jgi:RimK family alpha-L-glutamate ligase